MIGPLQNGVIYPWETGAVFSSKAEMNPSYNIDFICTLKALMLITFSSPRAQPEVEHFLISNESLYFSGCKSKIVALNSL